MSSLGAVVIMAPTNARFIIVGHSARGVIRGRPLSGYSFESLGEDMPGMREVVAAHERRIEDAARRIYNLMPYRETHPIIKPPWVPGGNSTMQNLARRYARAAIEEE